MIAKSVQLTLPPLNALSSFKQSEFRQPRPKCGNPIAGNLSYP